VAADDSGRVGMKKQQELQPGLEAERKRCYLPLPAATVLVASLFILRSCEIPNRRINDELMDDVWQLWPN